MVPVSPTSQRRLPFGLARRVPVQSADAVTVDVACKPGGRSGILDVARFDVTGAPRLRREQPDDAALDEVGQGVDQPVDQVAVTVTPPVDDAVDDVLDVLVRKVRTDDGFELCAQVVVHVLVVAEFLQYLSRLETQPGGIRPRP